MSRNRRGKTSDPNVQNRCRRVRGLNLIAAAIVRWEAACTNRVVAAIDDRWLQFIPSGADRSAVFDFRMRARSPRTAACAQRRSNFVASNIADVVWRIPFIAPTLSRTRSSCSTWSTAMVAM